LLSNRHGRRGFSRIAWFDPVCAGGERRGEDQAETKSSEKNRAEIPSNNSCARDWASQPSLARDEQSKTQRARPDSRNQGDRRQVASDAETAEFGRKASPVLIGE